VSVIVTVTIRTQVSNGSTDAQATNAVNGGDDALVPALDIYLYILQELNCSELIVPKIGLNKMIVQQIKYGS
jgi:hypothetical protein